MPTQPTLGMNPMLALLPPDQQQNLMQLQQQQAIGQALLQQGLQPIDTSNRQVAGMGYRISPLEGLAKMANMYVGNKIARDSMGQQAQIMGQMYGNAFGGQPQAPQAAPTDAGGMAGGQSGPGVVSSPIATPGASDLGAAMGGGTQVGPQTQMANGVLTMPGKTPQQSMILFSMLGPDAYAKMLQAQTAPTAATLAARQGGFDPAAANQVAFRHDTYNAPINGTGTFRDPYSLKPVAFSASDIPGTRQLYDAAGNSAGVEPLAGAQEAMQGNAAATAAGGAQFKPVQVYNPVTHQMEYSNEVAVTNPSTGRGGGAAPTLSGIFAQQESSGGKTAPDNPMQIQQGTFKQYAQPGESWSNPADRTTVANRVLSTYQQKYGGDLGRIATAYFSGEGNVAPAGSPTPYLRNVSDENGKSVASYVGDIQARAGSGGAPAAAPPLGAQANVEAQVKGQVDTMQKSYQNLQTVRSGAPAALQDVDNMSKLAQGANPLTIGPAGAKFAGLFSANAAEYEKSRDNLVTNLGSQLGINSDAARDLVYGSIPSYGAPKQAVQNGLETLRGQIQTRLLKSDYLSDAYAAGDAKSYNQRENQFDQHVTPAAANQISILNSMPTGPAKADALKALKGNSAFEWAASNGILK